MASVKRYEDNKGIIDDAQYDKIHAYHIVIIGAGGLGGALAESFARLGVKKITIIDPDTFQTKNLNRQRFATRQTLGKNKVDVIKEGLHEINENVSVHALHSSIERCYHDLILRDADLLVDAVDEIKTKCYIESLAKTYNIPLLHGAIGGWYGQFAMITHDYTLLNNYYGRADNGIEKVQKCPTFAPLIIVGMMVAEWLNYIIEASGFTCDTLYFYDAKSRALEPLFNSCS